MSERSPSATGTSTRERRPAHRRRYLAHNPVLRTLMRASDLVLRPLRWRVDRIPAVPRRVLLALGGHLGDAVIATTVIDRLASALPDAELGVLMPSWSQAVLARHPRLVHRHSADHWFLNRSTDGLVARWRLWRRTRRRAIHDIRSVGYDAAIDLYDYFPNSALLLWRAGIPVRIGFDAAGFAPLYTHAVSWPDDTRHTAERHLLLLRTLLPSLHDGATPLAPQLPVPPEGAASRADAFLTRHRLGAGAFIVVHPGAGSAEKDWPFERWRTVVAGLCSRGRRLLFTGKGEREHEFVRALLRDCPDGVDACDQLTWDELVHVVGCAAHVVSVDTVIGHIAAAVGTPATTIWTSPSSPDHWRPLGSATVVVASSRVPAGDADSSGSTSDAADVTPAEVLASVLDRGADGEAQRLPAARLATT